MSAASAMRHRKSSDWIPPAAGRRRMHLSSIRRSRDDPFEREADSAARAARTHPGPPLTTPGVRLHHDEVSAAAAQALGAHAFTVGDDVFFGRDEYRPETAEGRGLVAHEMTHVAQQRRDASAPPLQGSWWEAVGAIIGAVGGVVAGLAVGGGFVGAAAFGVVGAFLGGVAGGALRHLFGADIDRTEPEDKGLAQDDPKFQEMWQKNLKEGMDLLARSSCAFPRGRDWKYDDRYWKRVDDPNFAAYKPKGVSPAKAVDELINNLNLWEFDCALYPEVIYLYAYRKTLGAANFNTRFHDLVLRQHRTEGIHEKVIDADHDHMDAAEFNKKWDDAPAGSKVMWTNRSHATDATAWKNENGIKRTKGSTPDEDRYDTHPIGSNLSERQVKFGLAKAASDFPVGAAARETYVNTNIYRHELHLLQV